MRIEAGAVGLINLRPYATSAQAVLNMARVQRKIFVVVPITAMWTLLFAAFLGLAVTGASLSHSGGWHPHVTQPPNAALRFNKVNYSRRSR